DPALAQSLQIWRRAVFEEACCLPTLPSATDPGDYMLVQPLGEAAEDQEIPSDEQVIDAPAQRWGVELKGLSPQLQTANLGDELLTGGSVVVELTTEHPGPVLHGAAQKSAENGDGAMKGVSLTPFLGCLPLLESPLAQAVLSSPEGQGNSAGR